MDLNAYIGREIPCGCGKRHYSSLKGIDIGPGAVNRLPEHIKALGYRKVYLITDRNIMKAAGERAAAALTAAGIPWSAVVLEEDEPIPDENAIGRVLVSRPADADLFLAVGSGTVNDLSKYVSCQVGADAMVFASAPSMDGFASTVAALMLNRTKTTLPCRAPVMVIGDTDVLSAAPMRLIAAGLGDTLGKYTCLTDWKLSRLINGEIYCDRVAGMVRESLRTVRDYGGRVKERDPEAVKAVMEALVLTGIAMSFMGNSRPASGCEHHCSHYWEMKTLLEGGTPALHGEQVGVGMILALKLYHALEKEEPDFDALKERPYDREAWTARMRALYGVTAGGIIALEDAAGKNDPAKRNRRLEAMKAQWPEIRRIIREELPPAEEMEDLLRSLSAPVRPTQIGLKPEAAAEAVEAAKELRDRYTLLQILWDLGLTEKYAAMARENAG